eukprot:scaffold4616_cov29-Cyclotella_meneghiniana.AAC.2
MKKRHPRASSLPPSSETTSQSSNSPPAAAALIPSSLNHRRSASSKKAPSILSATALTLSLAILFYLTRSSNNNDKPSSLKSLLQVHSTSHLPPCTAHRHSLKDVQQQTRPASDKPTIYTDWTVDNSGMESTSSFIDRYGHIPQYVKMGDALPLMDTTASNNDGNNKYCIVPFKTLLNTLLRRFVYNESSNNNNEPPPKRTTQDDILIFTNHIESPSLFTRILKQYTTPSPLSYTAQYTPSSNNEEYGYTKIFSVVMRRSSHRFHIHDEAWLGQVSGSRLWFLLPPSTSKDELVHKPPACEYLYNRETLPSNAMACIQNAGEVMYLPKDWWHATCGLEEWNVGVGEQLGAPTVFGPPELDESGVDGRKEVDWEEKLDKCRALL